MILVFFFASILICLPFLHSATDPNTSKPICPESFSCPNSAPFNYPFYNVTHTQTQCGLIKVRCTWNGTEIKFGESYQIVDKVRSDSSVLVYNRTFESLVKSRKCEALMYDLTSPSPLLYSISIEPFIVLYKCKNNATYAAETNAYFLQSNYSTYNRCKHHNFYFKYSISNTTIPSDLPPTCQLIRLPVRVQGQFRKVLNETDIFSVLGSVFAISFKLSPSCDHCHKEDGHCDTSGGQFHCSDAKKDNSQCHPHDGLQCSTAKKVASEIKKARRKLIWIPVLAVSVFILFLFLAIFIIWRCYKSNSHSYFSSKDRSSNTEDWNLSHGVSVFSYTELEDATRNFDPSKELGNGGFGAVYYGKLQDGREVAVKRLYEHNYKRVQQFMNEVKLLTRLRHPNFVVLYGCTSRQSHELLLVYEYISNGTVADHLHGERANTSLLTWPLRMNIAIHTARALVYLHASEIIHRDVKSSNILLDHNFSAKVADFGLSRLLPNDVTHVSTAPQGTPGYVDPQYHHHYQLTDKSDVYSFGVVLIELISSMVAVDLSRSHDEISLANLALNRIQRCELDQLIDPVLGSDSDAEIMRMTTSVAELAFQCLQFYSEMRPTMNEVLDILEDIQHKGRIDGDGRIRDLESVKPSPPCEASDKTVLLKDFLPSPVSVSSECLSDSTRSTTLTVR